MHPSTMQYLKPSEEQIKAMAEARVVFTDAMTKLDAIMPAGRYKSLTMTSLEQAAMWANKGITREDDGAPRPGALV